jgi:MerR family transcriptional regulator/heat shock protein HspR
MSTLIREMIVVLKSRDLLTLEALARRVDMHPDLVERYVELGLIHPCEGEGPSLVFEPSTVLRLGAVNRLRQSLGINMAGIAVVLDLIDQICALQDENHRLRRRQ